MQATSVLHITKAQIQGSRGATSHGGSRPSDSVFSGSEGLGHDEGLPISFVITACGNLPADMVSRSGSRRKR